jgi:hypothetical protein
MYGKTHKLTERLTLKNVLLMVVAVRAVLLWDARAVYFVPFAFRAEQSVAAELSEEGVIMPCRRIAVLLRMISN